MVLNLMTLFLDLENYCLNLWKKINHYPKNLNFFQERMVLRSSKERGTLQLQMVNQSTGLAELWRVKRMFVFYSDPSLSEPPPTDIKHEEIPPTDIKHEEIPGWSLSEVDKMAIDSMQLAQLGTQIEEDEEDYDEEG